MLGQGAGPGVPHTQDPDQPADIMGVRRELDERADCRSPQEIVEVLLLTTDDLSALMRHRADHVHVGDREELLTPVFQPGVGLQVMPRGATAMAAGVVDIMVLTALRAWQPLPAYGLGPASAEIRDGPALTGQQILPKPVQVRTSIAPQDVRHLRQAQTPARQRAAMRALMVAGRTSKVGGVRGV
jgi:hypothetical protein